MRLASSITTCMSCSTMRIVRFLAMRRTRSIVPGRSAAHELHRAVGLCRAHTRSRLIQAQQLRLGRKGDADLEVALLAVGEVGGQLVCLGSEADRVQYRRGLVDDVAEVAVVVSMLQPW